MSTTVRVVLDPPSNGEFYTLEDVIGGSVVLGLEKSVNIREVMVKLVGQSEAVVRPGDHLENEKPQSLQVPLSDNRSLHEVVKLESSVFPPENVKAAMKGSRKPFKVKKGEYKFPFEFHFPSRPQCIQRHQRKLFTYLKGHTNPKLPPSFNNLLSSKDVLNLNAYFYSLGRIEYFVEATVFTGGDEMWFKPFRSYPALKRTFEFIPSNVAQEHLEDALRENPNTPPQVFRSKFDVTFEGSEQQMWVEVRSKHLRSVYRLDYLFRPSGKKFNQVFLCMLNPLPESADLRVARVELNLIEVVTYLAGNRSNANLSSLRLAGVDTDYKVDLTKCQQTESGFTECHVELSDIYPLDMIRFNEEDYKHNGNRLYSFDSCNIRRRFKFQLFLHWTLNGVDHFQTEVLTNFTNIFCESVTVAEQPPDYMEEQLPKYE